VKSTVEMENVGAVNLDDVRFMRSVDPDNTVDHTLMKTDLAESNFASNQAWMQFQWDLFKTDNKILRTVDADGYAAVTAFSQANDAYFQSRGKRAALTYFSREPSARVSQFMTRPHPDYPGWDLTWETAPPGNVYDAAVYDNTPPRGTDAGVLDGWIAIAFKIDQLTPNEKKKVTFYTSMDDRPIDDQIANLAVKSYPAVLLDKIKCCGFQKTNNIENNPTCHTGSR